MLSACSRSKASASADLADQNPIRPVAQCRPDEIRNRHRGQRRLLAEWDLGPPRFKPHEIRLLDQDFGRLLDENDPIAVGDRCGERIQQRRLARAGPAGDQDVLAVADGCVKLRGEVARERSDVDELVQGVAVRELPNGQRRAVDRARREHRGHARAILKPCVEHRLVSEISSPQARAMFLIATVRFRTSSVRAGLLEPAMPLDEHAAAAAVHHDLCHARIDQEILDRPQERQNAVQAAHSAPRSR